jgi:hypothetical protein
MSAPKQTYHQAIVARWRTLANVAAGIVPSECKNPDPCRADADALVSDLRVLARHVDALIEAYGAYARFALGVSGIDVKEHFTNTLSNALDGNATFAIEDAAAAYADSMADRMADLSRAIEAAE